MCEDKPRGVTRRALVCTLACSTLAAPLVVWKQFSFMVAGSGGETTSKGCVMTTLPEPLGTGTCSVEQAVRERRTVRSFSAKMLQASQLSQLLWAAQGITEEGGFKRAAPSAGALFPMDVYAALGSDGVKGFAEGIYHYEPVQHAVSLDGKGDVRSRLARAALSQSWIAQAPVVLVITAEYDRITGKYGQRGVRYAMIEAGHIAQNIFLQARALGLAAGIVGAFVDEEVTRVLMIPDSHAPLVIMPVGFMI